MTEITNEIVYRAAMAAKEACRLYPDPYKWTPAVADNPAFKAAADKRFHAAYEAAIKVADNTVLAERIAGNFAFHPDWEPKL